MAQISDNTPQDSGPEPQTEGSTGPLDLVFELSPLALSVGTGLDRELTELLPKYRGWDDKDHRALMTTMESVENKLFVATGFCRNVHLGRIPVPGLKPFGFIALAMLTDLGWYPLFCGLDDPTSLVHAREVLGLPAYLIQIDSNAGENDFSFRVNNLADLNLRELKPGDSPKNPLGREPKLVTLRQLPGPDRLSLSAKELIVSPVRLGWQQAATAGAGDMKVGAALPRDLPFLNTIEIEKAWLGKATLSIEPASEVFQLDRRHVHLPALSLPYKTLLIQTIISLLKQKLERAYRDPGFIKWLKGREKKMSISFWGYEDSIDDLILHFSEKDFEINQSQKTDDADLRLAGYLPAIMEILQGQSTLLRLIGKEIEIRPRRKILQVMKIVG